MKNIHILPTDQPSRLYLEYGDGDLCLANNPLPQTSRSNNQHLYVTSDEKLKQNDWCLHDGVVYIMRNHMISRPSYNAKKIILTTDPTLIPDGVQVIDDEFLEWFVKNPSCEFVEVNKKLVEFPLTFKMMYKIIIPQEESKQEILPEFKLSKDIFNKLSCLSSKDLSPELKQLVNDNWDYLIGADDVKNEIRYSEDEVRELLIKGLTHNDDKLCGSLVTVQKEIRTANFNVWFEENKKK